MLGEPISLIVQHLPHLLVGLLEFRAEGLGVDLVQLERVDVGVEVAVSHESPDEGDELEAISLGLSEIALPRHTPYSLLLELLNELVDLGLRRGGRGCRVSLEILPPRLVDAGWIFPPLFIHLLGVITTRASQLPHRFVETPRANERHLGQPLLLEEGLEGGLPVEEGGSEEAGLGGGPSLEGRNKHIGY